MKSQISLIHLSSLAWKDFCKDWKSWVLLALGGVVLMLVSIAAYLYFPEYNFIISFVFTILGAFYAAILHKNGLDAAYGRSLSMIQLNGSILFGTLFFIALSMYHPFPEYSEILLLFFPEDFEFLLWINWIVHLLISYLLVRCMFIGMIVLEEKSKVIVAVKKSFALTSNHIFILLAIFMYLAIILALSALTVVGYFIALPYTILLKSLLFKYLNDQFKQNNRIE
ncbi:MAG: hypothetical protein ACXWL5_03205 [Candidatus Chromulinivorax sp.]